MVDSYNYCVIANVTNEKKVEVEDLFEEENQINSFIKIVTESQYQVFGLAADWGTGKTTFIKMFQEHMQKQHLADSSVIYIDAFAKDYIEDPFLMLVSAINHYMKENNVSDDDKDKQKFNESVKKIINATIRAALLATSCFIPSQFLADFSKSLIGEISYDPSSESEDICEELKSSLKSVLSKSGSKTLYIVLDELDRCRPDFALETLERIKHLFSVEGIKFILVYNPKVFCGIVKQKYGCDDYDAENYIRKFVDREIAFAVDMQYLKLFIYEKTLRLLDKKAFTPVESSSISSKNEAIADVLSKYCIKSLRDIQQFLASIKIYENDVSDKYRVEF